MKRDPEYIRHLVIGSTIGTDNSSKKLVHKRAKKLRIDELYAMYLTRKSYAELTMMDKEVAREELGKKVLKYYFTHWSYEYFKLMRELDDFYSKFPRAGRDRITFVRFIRSLSVLELKRIFNAEPQILYSASLWLRRYRGKAKRNKGSGEFYAKVAQAVSELGKDKWIKKLVKTVLNLARKVETVTENGMGKKELSFYDYYAAFVIEKSKVAPATAFAVAVLTTRHIIAHYFFDPNIGYRQRLEKIKEHFKPIFNEYKEAEQLMDEYFIRSVIESMSPRDIIQFTGADSEKLERYYRKNLHKFSAETRRRLVVALNTLALTEYETKRKWWNEHRLALYSLTALAEW